MIKTDHIFIYFNTPIRLQKFVRGTTIESTPPNSLRTYTYINVCKTHCGAYFYNLKHVPFKILLKCVNTDVDGIG